MEEQLNKLFKLLSGKPGEQMYQNEGIHIMWGVEQDQKKDPEKNCNICKCPLKHNYEHLTNPKIVTKRPCGHQFHLICLRERSPFVKKLEDLVCYTCFINNEVYVNKRVGRCVEEVLFFLRALENENTQDLDHIFMRPCLSSCESQSERLVGLTRCFSHYQLVDGYMEKRYRLPTIHEDKQFEEKEQDRGRFIKSSCPICLCDIEQNEELTYFPCTHKVHKVCWEHSHNHNRQRCPFCRTSVN